MTFSGLIKYERCENWLYHCPFTNSTGDCVNHFCNGQPNGFGSCSDDFPAAGACCQKADPAGCLHDFQRDLGEDHDGACATVRRELAKCDTISGFATIAPYQQAGCLCYNTKGDYAPSVWDNAATSCWASGSSAHPYLFSLLTMSSSEALGFCTKFAGPSSASATTTGSETETETKTETETDKESSTTTAGSTTTTNSAVAASTTTSPTTAPATAGTAGTAGTSSASSTAATASKSSSTLRTPVDKRMLVLGLFLAMPALLMNAM